MIEVHKICCSKKFMSRTKNQKSTNFVHNLAILGNNETVSDENNVDDHHTMIVMMVVRLIGGFDGSRYDS